MRMIADIGKIGRALRGISPADASLYALGGEGTIDGKAIASDPARADLARELTEEAARLLAAPIPRLAKELYETFERTGDRLAYEGVYFARRRRLTTFGLLALLDPERLEYADALAKIVRAVLEEETWCLPAHMRGETAERGIDLFAAETGFALAELMTLTGELLPAELRERMREAVDRRLFVPYLTMGPYSWETADHNWASVCAGSIGAAALLLERNSDRLTEITRKAVGSMACYLSGFGDDGACLEGIGYWNYGFGYFVYYADLLYRTTGGAVDLLADPKAEKIATFQQRSYLFGDRTVNFSDAAPRAPAHRGLSAYLAARYPAVEMPPAAIFAALKDDHCSRFAPALRDLLWYRRGPDETDREAWPPGSAYLPNAEWLVSRHESAQGRFGFAAKGGHNGEPHNHIDVGHFLLVAEGEPAFAADLGRGEYTARYFGDGRYSYDCTGAHGHSLPVVGGREQQPGAARRARVRKAVSSPEEDLLELELVDAYDDPRLASFVRRATFRKSDLPELEVDDEFAFRGPAEPIEEIVVSRCEPAVVSPGEIVLRGTKLNVRLIYDAGLFVPSVERRTFPGHDGAEERYYKVALRASEPGGGTRVGAKLRFAFEHADAAMRGADDVRPG